MNKLIMMIGAAAVAVGAYASSVTIDSVTQRWPWNNKVDIKYTIAGGQTLTADGTGDVYCRLEFTATVNGQSIVIDGRAIGANASTGQHTATWTPPANLRVKALDCTMTARLLSADNPSGDDYMIIDLDTGSVTYEGLLYSQDLSNARYNTATYKTDKMVLRKVPRWVDRASLPNAASLPSAGYPTGDDFSTYTYKESDRTTYWVHNYATNWVTRKTYYVGVFPVTQAQYVKFGQTNPSPSTQQTDSSGNIAAHRPVTKALWYDLRGNGTAPDATLPEVDSNTGTYLQRLNYKTGNKFAFDLPTEIMSEIACRAGNQERFFWGSDFSDIGNYAVCDTNITVAVGSKLPNDWGLYDTIGNTWELCRDHEGLYDLGTAADPFVPYVESGTLNGFKMKNGGPWDTKSSGTGQKLYYCYASYSTYQKTDTFVPQKIGFRVSCIVK